MDPNEVVLATLPLRLRETTRAQLLRQQLPQQPQLHEEEQHEEEHKEEPTVSQSSKKDD